MNFTIHFYIVKLVLNTNIKAFNLHVESSKSHNLHFIAHTLHFIAHTLPVYFILTPEGQKCCRILTQLFLLQPSVQAHSNATFNG